MCAMAFAPGGVEDPSSIIEIVISCRNLKSKDVLSKSDPMCVTYIWENGKWLELHRTEIMKNAEQHVTFMQRPRIKYFFEREQRLKFEVYDIDNSNVTNLKSHDFLGAASINLGALVSANTVKAPLKGSGSIQLLIEEVAGSRREVEMEFRGHGLDKKDFFGSSDPFLEISKSATASLSEGEEFILVHRTEVIKNTLNPSWKRFSLPIQRLCGGNENLRLRIQCYDWDSDGGHDLIGQCYTTLQKLKELPQVGASSGFLDLIHPKKQKKHKSSGHLFLTHINVFDKPSFLDYIRGGTELNVTFAIDFTASNGHPRDPNSLHYMNPLSNQGISSPYSRAIWSVGNIIRDYDSDKKFPVLGFGARIPPDGQVSHEFFVNGSLTDPYCEDVHGVLTAYQDSLQRVQLSGPTNFSPVIRHVARFASAFQNGSHYFILVIITDGIITDFPETKDALVEASGFPISVVIVGVGNNTDFSSMNQLDSDQQKLTSRSGQTAIRDIVQFVHFSCSVDVGVDFEATNANLAELVLAEIPTQFLAYMKLVGVQPKPPRQDNLALPPDPEFQE